MIKELVRLANHLDKKGLRREADYLDSVVRKYAADPGAAAEGQPQQQGGANLESLNGWDQLTPEQQAELKAHAAQPGHENDDFQAQIDGMLNPAGASYHMSKDDNSIWAQSASGWYRYDTASNDWVLACTQDQLAADQCRDENGNSLLPSGFTERRSTEAEIIESGYQPLKK